MNRTVAKVLHDFISLSFEGRMGLEPIPSDIVLLTVGTFVFFCNIDLTM